MLGLTARLHTIAGRFAATLGETKLISRLVKRAPKFYKALANNVVVPGVATTAEWAIAESAGQALLGGKHSDLWKAQTIDLQTGETRFMFPFVMGASGSLVKKLGENN